MIRLPYYTSVKQLFWLPIQKKIVTTLANDFKALPLRSEESKLWKGGIPLFSCKEIWWENVFEMKTFLWVQNLNENH